jgi:hypothetical protein
MFTRQGRSILRLRKFYSRKCCFTVTSLNKDGKRTACEVPHILKLSLSVLQLWLISLPDYFNTEIIPNNRLLVALVVKSIKLHLQDIQHRKFSMYTSMPRTIISKVIGVFEQLGKLQVLDSGSLQSVCLEINLAL